MAIAAFALAASFCIAQSQPRNTPSKTSSGTKDPKAAAGAGPVVNDSKWTKGPSKEWFVNWDKALYGDVLFSKSWRELAHSSKIQTDIPYTGYGYGWFIEKYPNRPLKIYHTGDNGGFQAYLAKYPERGVVIVVLENRNDLDRWSMAREIDRILLNNSIL